MREIPAPLNVQAGAGALPAPELFKLGVRRLSIGGAAMLATMGLVRDIARELQELGTYSEIEHYAYTHADATKLMS